MSKKGTKKWSIMQRITKTCKQTSDIFWRRQWRPQESRSERTIPPAVTAVNQFSLFFSLPFSCFHYFIFSLSFTNFLFFFLEQRQRTTTNEAEVKSFHWRPICSVMSREYVTERMKEANRRESVMFMCTGRKNGNSSLTFFFFFQTSVFIHLGMYQAMQVIEDQDPIRRRYKSEN